MRQRTARCLLLTGAVDAPKAGVTEVPLTQVPNEGDTLVRVLYSGLNYKDALAVTGRGKIIRSRLPFVPGIDAVGEVVESPDGCFRPGDRVIATGWGLGEDRWGGYSEYLRVRADQLVRLPAGMTLEVAATAGTAGLTAMLATLSIESGGVDRAGGEVLVTGASGGVGSLSVLFLSTLGYTVVASTGKPTSEPYLRELGASSVIDRSSLSAGPQRPLDSSRWIGAVDSVGGTTLSAILSCTGRHGVVASCGLVGGAELHTTVYPFILRGVSLIGIDSNTCPNDRRDAAWDRIGKTLTPEVAARVASTIDLEEIPARSLDVLAGQVTGRLVVRVASRSS